MPSGCTLHCWPGTPLQLHTWAALPFVEVLVLTSMHLPVLPGPVTAPVGPGVTSIPNWTSHLPLLRCVPAMYRIVEPEADGMIGELSPAQAVSEPS